MVVHVYHRQNPERGISQVDGLTWVAAIAVDEPKGAIPVLLFASRIYPHWGVNPMLIGVHGVRETTAGDILVVNDPDSPSGRRFYQLLHHSAVAGRAWKYRLRKIKNLPLPSDSNPDLKRCLSEIEEWVDQRRDKTDMLNEYLSRKELDARALAYVVHRISNQAQISGANCRLPVTPGPT